ncbi:MAG: hypothetical protein JWO60_2758 [Frankiales bacterium]|nr:hypothetical protein [Frankiales bacterium]
MDGLAKRVRREVVHGLVAEMSGAAEALAVERVRAKALRKHEKAVARRERTLARARRAVPVFGVLTAAGSLLTAQGGLSPIDVVFLPLAVLGATRLASAVSTLRHPPPVPVPAPLLTAPPPPPQGSSAWPAVHRLDRCREQVARLAPLVGPSGQAAAAEALQAGGEADLALRWQAARLGATEEHRGVDPLLLQTLLDGVACQERLVTALADLVAASDPTVSPGGSRLQDAADALHGLADGLRQVR